MVVKMKGENKKMEWWMTPPRRSNTHVPEATLPLADQKAKRSWLCCCYQTCAKGFTGMLMAFMFLNLLILDLWMGKGGGWGQGGGGPGNHSATITTRTAPSNDSSNAIPIGTLLTALELKTRSNCEQMRKTMSPKVFLPYCLPSCTSPAVATCSDVGIQTPQTAAFCLFGQFYASSIPNPCNGPISNVVLDGMGWMAGDNVCTWAGITCDPASALPTALVVTSLPLNATLPLGIGYMNSLTQLFLQQNSLQGSIPASICARSWSGGCKLSGNPGLNTATICASCAIV